MKTIKHTCAVLAASILMALTGCNQWLEENPTTNVDLEDYQGLEAMKSLLTGAYAMVMPTYNVGSHIGVVGNDEVMTMKNNNMNVFPFEQYNYTSSTKAIDNAWTNNYSVIQRCNMVIDRTQADPKVGQTDKQFIVAQARFLRAFIYFRLVQWFGALPLVVDETVQYDRFLLNTPRSDISDVYALIISDLEYAATPGVLDERVSDGTVTRYAAVSLLAKVYLTMGTSKARLEYRPEMLENSVLAQYADLPFSPEEYYTRCYNLCLQVINSGYFDLIADFPRLYSINSADKNKNGESIWEVQFSSARGYGSGWSKQFGINGNGGQVPIFSAVAGHRTYQPVPSFWGFYKKGDQRLIYSLNDRAVSFTDNDQNKPPSDWNQHRMTADSPDQATMNAAYRVANYNNNISCYKYVWTIWQTPEEYSRIFSQIMSGFGADNCPNNVIVLRYADVLLMFVEADMLRGGATPADMNSTGASSAGLEAMNRLLYRARGNKTEGQMWECATDTWGYYRYDAQGKPIPVAADESERSRYLKDYNDSDNPLTFRELTHQRACELCFEFHRYNDLLRWGILKEMVDERVFDPTYNRPQVQTRHYLFPLPLNSLQSSPNKTGFYQNPGY